MTPLSDSARKEWSSVTALERKDIPEVVLALGLSSSTSTRPCVILCIPQSGINGWQPCALRGSAIRDGISFAWLKAQPTERRLHFHAEKKSSVESSLYLWKVTDKTNTARIKLTTSPRLAHFVEGIKSLCLCLFQDAQYFCGNEMVEMKSKFLWKTFYCFNLQPLSLISPYIFHSSSGYPIWPLLLTLRIHPTIRFHCQYPEGDRIRIVNMVVTTHDVLVVKPLLCRTVSFMEISRSLDLVMDLSYEVSVKISAQ